MTEAAYESLSTLIFSAKKEVLGGGGKFGNWKVQLSTKRVRWELKIILRTEQSSKSFSENLKLFLFFIIKRWLESEFCFIFSWIFNLEF